MKIKETIERECCEPKDLKRYHGIARRMQAIMHPVTDLFFCVHCGELWDLRIVDDPCGETETKFIRFFEYF